MVSTQRMRVLTNKITGDGNVTWRKEKADTAHNSRALR